MRLSLESLESRTVPTTITRTSASIFYNDLVNDLTSAYASYKITNTDGVNYPDVWATIGNFTAASGSPVVTLAPSAASSIDLGPLAAGQTKTAFFYLGSTADTTVTQTHTVSVFNGPPASGTLLTSQNFSFTAVADTIESNANKVTSVIVSPSTPTVGGTFTITVTGQTGTIGAAKVLNFTPAAYSSWRADSFQLVGTTITFSGGNTGTFTNTLLIPPASITSTADTVYTAVYTFQAVGPTATPTNLSPVGYFSSGAGVDHTATGNFATLPPVLPPLLASPTLDTTPTPATVTLGTTPVTLKDTAVLANGFRPTGSITFTLVDPTDTTVDTETVPVNGNGTYATPNGFTLPSSGIVIGTYQWNATYSGDTDNYPANDVNDIDEQVTVTKARPTLVTTASPNVTLPTGPPGTVTLSDTADLEGGYSPTGSIVFTLTGPGGFTFSQTDTVTSNGTYTASTTLPTSGTADGTYTWTATYGGDPNNAAANDQGGVGEQTVVTKASPTLTTAPSPSTITLGDMATPVLTDTAMLANGYYPTGTITFTLVGPGGTTVDTEVVTVNGNGNYTTPSGFTLPTTGAATGTYQWDARYSGSPNNKPANDVASVDERVAVTRASPTLNTTASSDVTLPTGPPGTVTLSDSADLEGGYSPTGNIDFTLSGPGGFTFTETDTVTGNGIYTASTTLPTSGVVAGTYTWTVHYGGDTNNAAAKDQGGVAEQTVVGPASPTLATTPRPSTLATDVTLKDTAVLAGGYHPTGTITFELFFNGGATPVHTEMVAVDGNGVYTTPTGFTPGTATGTYQWDATYGGDHNNNAASDINDPVEQVTVTPPTLSLTTTPIPATVTLGINSVKLNDTASLAGGVDPTGTIIFTLFHNGGTTAVDTETVTVNGSGTYTTPTGYTLPSTGTATGTYQWNASYSGDANNPAASDINNLNEQVMVNPASPGLVTIASPSSATLGATSPTLRDFALLAGGYHPTGMITFTLTGPGGTMVDTEMATVNGNGIYSTPIGFTVPSSGTAAGTYQWHATYSGDPNNNPGNELSPVTERVTVRPASPTLTTSPSPNTVTLGTTPVTLNDSATLANGYHPTGTITFTLLHDGTPVDSESVPVTGNKTFTTPTGFTLPSSGTATGTYQWNAAYSGDTNNRTASDVSNVTEQVTVSRASPTLVTTASPGVTLPTGPPGTVTLSDTAILEGGYSPTGNIVFTLSGPGGFTFTQTDTVNGNNPYTASTTLPTLGTVAGTYTWTAHYGGDPNNAAANDQGGIDEQTVVTKASPRITTNPSPSTVTLGTSPVKLTDSAVLANGYHPIGTITFTLVGPGGATLNTEMVAVSGNGAYTTPTGFTLSGSGKVTGTYRWDARYSGGPNNNPASDIGDTSEQVKVNAASPIITTTPVPTTVTLTAAAPPVLTDQALLTGGYHPTGTITFTLFYNGSMVNTETVAVNGNHTYRTRGGYRLPTTGVVTGTYQWNATYSGDPNNNPASDINSPTEQVTVIAASPTITTTTPINHRIVSTAPGVTDSATLSGGAHPTGTITFTLFYNGSMVDSETVTVNGNRTYTTPEGFVPPTTGTVTGVYQWDATYSGDPDNSSASDINSPDEQVTITSASPTISTTPNPTSALLGTTLQDVAVLTSGYRPTGSITFNLYAPGVNPAVGSATYTETVPVNGDGTYSTSVGFTTTVTGIWHWVASYEGDSNNNVASSGPLDEPANVQDQADVAVTKIANPIQVRVGFNVTYTVTVHNLGPNSATDNVADDPLPSGLTFISAVPSQGSYDPQSGIWVIGTLAPGRAAVLTVTARVDIAGPILNKVEAGALQFDPNLSNNAASATVMGLASGISKRDFLASTDPPPARPAPPSLATLRSDMIFIIDLYEFDFGQEATPANLAHWMNLLLLGVSRSAVAHSV